MELTINPIHSILKTDTVEETREVFSVINRYKTYAPGYRYTYQFKNRSWDGKVNLIKFNEDEKYFTIPTGFIPEILFGEHALSVPTITGSWTTELNLKETTVPLRPYQWEAIQAALQNQIGVNELIHWPRGVIQLAPRS
jgi:hypothetical protein